MKSMILLLGAAALAGACALPHGRAATAPPTCQPSATEAKGEPQRQEIAPPPEPEPWSVYTTMANGFDSNVNSDENGVNAYGMVVALGARFDGDDFSAAYEMARHGYTHSEQWDRLSHFASVSYERRLSRNWEWEATGQAGLKGSSEDRDIVDRDFEVSPRLTYQISPERRIRFFTVHRWKRYDDTPQNNAFKNYFGAEYQHVFGPRYHVEVGGRFETNDEPLARGDYRRWTYWVEHGVPVTRNDSLLLQIRYRLKHYDNRLIEVEDEDVLRLDHRWAPSVAWMRSVSPNIDLRLDYAYDTNYSNDPERAYNAHMFWLTVGYRWRR